MHNCFKVYKKGFTLAEIIVSMAITGMLLLGISLFFSSSFQSLFSAQTDAVNMENQFAVNEIIRSKFNSLGKILNKFTLDNEASELFFINNSNNGSLPFSYIGTVSDNGVRYLALKDFLIFNKIYHNQGVDFFADSGSGMIRRSDTGVEVTPELDPHEDFRNFSSFEIVGSDYYITFPYNNRVVKCPCDNGLCKYQDCHDLEGFTDLSSPTDIVKGKGDKFLYISDSGNGRIIKYDIDNEKQADFFPGQSVISGLNYPTGLAYYYDENNNKEWIFAAETLGNKVRRINLTSLSAIDVVAGDGEDAECTHTAKFCKLNMPTGLYADASRHELFISDSGNNRILKIKDPGIPDNLTFDFSLDDNYALDKIEFINSSWDGNGTYDDSYGNLIGTSDDFDNKIFSNASRLTTYEGVTVCKSTTSSFYVNESAAESLEEGDNLIIDNSVYTVKNPAPSSQDCIENDGLTRKEWLVNIEEPVIVAGGKTVFFSNPKGEEKVKIRIDGDGNPPKITFSTGGFQTFAIKTYDINKSLVETDYATFRIGDNILGTSEDTIEVFKDNLNFPTGVTNSYFADSGAKSGMTEIARVDGAISQPLNIIDTSAIVNFDYISDFPLVEGNPLTFKLFNSNTILEMIEKAQLSEGKIQTYTIDAQVP